MAEEDKLRTYLKRVTVDLADARTRLAEADAQRHEPLAVIGMSCRYPGADDVASFWDLLAEGRGAALDDVPDGRFDLDPFVADYGVYTKRGAFLRDIAGWDASFFDSPALEAMRMDPQQRLLMELTWEALEDAGTAPPSLRGSRTGVIVGFSDVFQYGQLQLGPDGAQAFTDPYTAQGSAASVAAGRLAYAFDLRGPAMVVDTACSSSLVAVHVAANALRSGECDLAVAAAASLVIKPQMYVNACAASMLSREGVCRTFDENADGYVMGEGGGVVVLERLSDALRAGRRVHAVIRGTAVNQDGRSNGLTAPNRSAQVDVIRRALAAARVSPEEIDYVEAHGSGTRLGDAIELGALGDVFGDRERRDPVLLGAVKTNIGHTQAAAGMAGLIKAALVLRHGVLPPNLNMAEPNGALAAGNLSPSAAAQPLGPTERPHLAGVSSFGWAGTNAHVIVEAAPAPAEAEAPAAAAPAAAPGGAEQPVLPELLPVSAAGPEALRAHLARLGAALGAADPAGGAPFADIVFTLQTGRAALGRRRALVAATAAEAAGLLKPAADADPVGVARVEETPRVAFLLPGVGDQYRGLGRGLYRDEPVFAAAVDRCLAAAAERCGVDLRGMFERDATDGKGDSARDNGGSGGFAALLGRAAAPDPADDPDHHARTAHLFLFTVEYALAQLLARRGVTPDLLIGYSLGEYVAACLAGVFSLEDALWVVAQRARLIEAAPEGRMLAAAAGAEQIESVLEGCQARVDVAALNGPAMTVLSGTPDAVDAVAARLADHGIAARPLRSAHAFHSSLLAPARARLAEVVASVRRAAPTTPVVSNVTGELLTADQATDPQYWAEHLCRPVRFADAARFAAAQGIDAFVELGAGQTLGGLLRQNTGPRAAAAVLGTLPAQWPAEDRADERASVLQTCGRLWELGTELDWDAVRGCGGRPAGLPSYPFQRTRYWPSTGGDAVPAAGRDTGRTAPTAADLCYAPAWQPDRVRHRGTPALPAGPLAVFADADGVGTALADLAAAGGTAVVEIVPGDGYRREGRRVTIDPARPEHYRQVFAALAAEGSGPVGVAHLWSLRDPARTPVFADDDELRTAVRHGFDSLLLALQALAQTAAERGVTLLTASAGCAEILGGDATAPDRALAHGLAHAVRAEYRGLAWHGVDLDPDSPPDQAASHLAEELRRGPWTGDDPAAEPALSGWRRGRRWTKNWARVALDEARGAGADLPSPEGPTGPHGLAGAEGPAATEGSADTARTRAPASAEGPARTENAAGTASTHSSASTKGPAAAEGAAGTPNTHGPASTESPAGTASTHSPASTESPAGTPNTHGPASAEGPASMEGPAATASTHGPASADGSASTKDLASAEGSAGRPSTHRPAAAEGAAGTPNTHGPAGTENAAGTAGTHSPARTESPAAAARTHRPAGAESAAAGPGGPWRPDGTYLITGGTRGLGLALARHLVRRGVRRLALVGRTDLAEAARREPDGPAAASIRAVAELEAAGAEVLPLVADVGVPDQLRRALDACREHFGALTGVVHAAGLPAGGLAERLTPEGAARVLRPKVAAMGPLAELVGPGTPPDRRPELLVLYSSAITVFGGLGEGDYSAANGVLDAYAAALAAVAPDTRVLSVAWGPWQHDDWQGEGVGGEFAQRVRAYRTAYGFADEAGCAFLDRLTAADGSVVALRQPLPEGLREWAALTDLDALAESAPAAPDAARFPRPQLRAEYVAPRSDLESAIAESWGRYLGIDRVGVHDPFFDLGGNSLVGMAMVASLADRLGQRIAPAVLFEHPTVAAFAAALAPPGTRAPGTAAPTAASGTGSARGARRRLARATQIPSSRK